jgi:uncharacterized protein YlxW (UPF0749 family)
MTAQLDALLADAMSSDYAAGQERKIGTSKVLAAIAGSTLVTFMIGVAIVDAQSNASDVKTTKAALIKRIQDTTARVDWLEEDVNKAAKDLQSAQQAKLAGTSLGLQAQQRLEQLQIGAGFTEVTGLGVQVTLDDAVKSKTSNSVEVSRVVDSDLQMVINGLWQAGATAIAINDHRLTSSSAIRSAGAAILVDYRPLVRPYKVVAIGKNDDALAGRFRENQAGMLLEELETKYGVIWGLETLGKVTLPAATSNLIGGTP